MKYVISNTGEPFQFSLGRNAVYSFDTEEPTAIGEADLNTIQERIGVLCLKEVDAPEEAPKKEEAPKEEESSTQE